MRATLFWIDYNSSTDTYEFSTNSPAHGYGLTVYLDTLLDNNSPRFTMGTGSQRFKLQAAEVQEQTETITGDWLLFLDEDDDEIYIRVGETITLRPFDEWTWKEGAIQNDHWYFPGDTNARQTHRTTGISQTMPEMSLPEAAGLLQTKFSSLTDI